VKFQINDLVGFRSPRNDWSSLKKQRQFMEALGLKLGLDPNPPSSPSPSLSSSTSLKDISQYKQNVYFPGWYNVSSKMVIENGGAGLLKHYDNSLSTLLGEVPILPPPCLPLRSPYFVYFHMTQLEDRF